MGVADTQKSFTDLERRYMDIKIKNSQWILVDACLVFEDRVV